MDAHRIHILHGTDHDGCIIGISHDFKFDLFPSGDGHLYKALVCRGEGKAVFDDGPKLLLILCDTASGTAQGKGRSYNDRVSDFLRKAYCTLNIPGDGRRGYRFTDFLHELSEGFPVFGLFDGLKIRSQDLHLEFLEYAVL